MAINTTKSNIHAEVNLDFTELQAGNAVPPTLDGVFDVHYAYSYYLKDPRVHCTLSLSDMS